MTQQYGHWNFIFSECLKPLMLCSNMFGRWHFPRSKAMKNTSNKAVNQKPLLVRYYHLQVDSLSKERCWPSCRIHDDHKPELDAAGVYEVHSRKCDCWFNLTKQVQQTLEHMQQKPNRQRTCSDLLFIVQNCIKSCILIPHNKISI